MSDDLLWYRREAGDDEQQVRWAASRRRSRFLAALPARAVEVALRADITEPAIAAVQRWWVGDKGRGGILVLSGPAGSGKTVAACWWALQLNWPPAFVRANDIAKASRFDPKAREKWESAGTLILDDLGAEYHDKDGTSSIAVDVDELVDSFYAERRWLVVTTNLVSKTFAKNYGARVMDRLQEAGKWITVLGPSRRRKSP